MVISSGAIIKKSTLPNRKSANSLARQNMPSLGRQKPNSPPQPIVTGSPNPTTTNGENKLEQEGQLPTARNALRQAVKTTSNPSTTNSENELEQETEEQTTQQSGTTSSSNTTSVENENEAEEEQTMSSQQTQQPTQQSTTQEEGEYEYENDYATTTDGQSGGRGGRGPQGVGAAGDNIFSGSWKDAVRENAREIALEMEGTWTAINTSTVGRKNTCPSYKMRYQGNAVVFDTIVGQCRVIITWNKRQQREQVKEKVSWGVNTYYRSRTIYVPVVTYVDLR
ncbi:uncharacterized protein LOC134241658 [Saccostrea cucullata]|uniref:uncharacterized protein LOC134241658 n=1 Tax=Saccostrea cuccullata TaxID=36930 RepID=UPI002ED2F966